MNLPYLKLIENSGLNSNLIQIGEAVLNGQRINESQGELLYTEGSLGFLSMLADHVRRAKNGDYVYYNRNIHIEPTNICVYNCRFCSYSHHSSGSSWDLSISEMVDKVKQMGNNITEVHIVGAVHPARDLYHYAELVRQIREARPDVHIKAFTAIEIEYMVQRAGVSLEEGLNILKESGVNSIPGGGAEIFDESIREIICGKKSTAKAWLNIHETAHKLGIPSNATILYGHIEQYSHRIHHLEKLRELQDRTQGFNAFIPLKYRNKNNELSWINEVSIIEDLKNFAISRIYLDNIPHIKAYWPMLGKQLAALSLSFGVDDMDGTINDSTKIYSMAGAEDESPSMTADEMSDLIRSVSRIPAERDSLYNIINS